MEELSRRVALTPYELRVDPKSGVRRYDTGSRFRGR